VSFLPKKLIEKKREKKKVEHITAICIIREIRNHKNFVTATSLLPPTDHHKKKET
jgi:hypothetical protein